MNKKQTIDWSLVTVKVSDLKPNPKNPKIRNDLGMRRLQKSIEKFGLIFGGIVNRDLSIIDGHSRIETLDGNSTVSVFMPNRQLNKREYTEISSVYDIANAGETDWDIIIESMDEHQMEEWSIPSCGHSGADWNYNYKGLEQKGDGLSNDLGFAPHSMWYGYPRDVEGISENCIKLPDQNKKSPYKHKYSRSSVEANRRIVLTYMSEGDYFLESCCGWSTFGYIAGLHGYSGIGIDIWDTAIEYSRRQVSLLKNARVDIQKKNAMRTGFKDNTYDYIYCNPPFMDAEQYSCSEDDIQENFSKNILSLIKENYRILKDGKLFTVWIGDVRKNGALISNFATVVNSGIQAGFKIHDVVILEVLGVANMFRKKAFEKNRMPKNHEFIITFKK